MTTSSNGITRLDKIMTPATRAFFISEFINPSKSFDSALAAGFFGVTSRTVNNWLKTGCPTWVDNYVSLYLRSIPDTEEWKDFRFSNDKRQLLTPYTNLSFTAADLLKHFFERQFTRMDKAQNAKLREQVDSLRNKEETEAIKQELNLMISTINKLKDSPLLANKGQFSKAVTKVNNERETKDAIRR